MLALHELQRAFGAAMLGGSWDAAAGTIAANGIAADARLAIYRNNIVGNLTGALKLTFPAVEHLVGADFFAAAVAHFLVISLPATANLYGWGEYFPAFLETFPPASSLPYLPDVARLEWAIGRALHAPQVPTLNLRALVGLATEVQAAIRFRPHPSLSLLSLRHPVYRIWQAVLARDETALGAIDPGECGEFVAVYQAAAGFDVLPLSPAGFAFADALCDGATLSMALSMTDAEAAPALLGAFLSRGLFSGLLSPPGNGAAQGIVALQEGECP